MTEENVCKAKRELQLSPFFLLPVQCDKYESHPTETHRTTITHPVEDDSITIYWKDSK